MAAGVPHEPDGLDAYDPGDIEQGDVDPDLEPAAVLAGPHWDIALVVAAGGAIGGLARLGVSTWFHDRAASSGGFPWATCTENVLGCLLIGVVMALVLEVWPPHRYLRPFLGTGILGGFTTFSTYSADTRALLADGKPATAAAYVVASLLLGLGAVVLGHLLVRAARPPAGRT